MNCANFHVEKTDARCPYCIIKMLIRALERENPQAPELTPAMMLIADALREQRLARKAAP